MTTFATSKNAATEGRILPLGKVSYEEFLAWADDKTFAEWVEGEVHLMSPVSRDHTGISQFLAFVLYAFTRKKQLGKVFSAPFQMRLRQVDRGREPDLMFVAAERLDRLENTYFDGAADLAIEIVSPESVIRDRGEKYAEYEAEGVREYWIIDPMARRTDFFVLREDGRYVRVDPSPKGVYRSHVLSGLWIRTDWLWADPLPDMDDVVSDWKTGTED